MFPPPGNLLHGQFAHAKHSGHRSIGTRGMIPFTSSRQAGSVILARGMTGGKAAPIEELAIAR